MNPQSTNPITPQPNQQPAQPTTNRVSAQVQNLPSQLSYSQNQDNTRQAAFRSITPGQQQAQLPQQPKSPAPATHTQLPSQNTLAQQQLQQQKLQQPQQPQQPQPQPTQPQQPVQQPQPQPTQPQRPVQQPTQQSIATPQLIPGKDRTAATTPSPSKGASTQSTLLISELRDGLVIMKDGSFRAVVACQSINFDLMSETEREGVEYSYQNFLNSLYFTTQILIRSQRVDLGPYIDRLTNIRRNNDNMLLGVLMDDYINFIDELSQEANIMDKSFFIVIPYYPDSSAEALKNQTTKLFGNKQAAPVSKISRATYNKAITEINNRVEAIVSGLFQIGIHSVRLNTRELATLYYNFNNPDTAVREPLVDFEKLATTYVKKGDKPANAPTI